MPAGKPRTTDLREVLDALFYILTNGCAWHALPHDFPEPPATTPRSPEPQPERQAPDQAAWLANLDALGIDMLFIATLYPGVLDAMAHDGEGFPVERAWADARPDRFSLAFANAGIRVYRTRRLPPDGPTR